MSTFTVFAFGTGEQSATTKNIISQFSEACTGPHAVVEGPDLLGREVKGNVKKTTRDIINWLAAQQDSDQNNINLTGFSRGSVTCIHIANHLKQYEHYLERRQDKLTEPGQKLLRQLKAINLNIFAMDPVAGMSDKSNDHARVIPDNVKNYVAVLQQDEMRRDFKPQDITRAIIAAPQITKVSMLPMYGNHSDTIKIKNPGMKSGATLAWYSVHQFLTQHGTTFTGDRIPQIVTSNINGGFSDLPQNPNAKDMLKLFTQHYLERENYRKSGQALKLHDGIPTPRTPRTLNHHLKYYVKSSYFFVNQGERELFKIAYPKVFNYLFEKNQFDLRYPHDSASQKPDVIAELTVLKQEDPELFRRLEARGVAYSDEGMLLGQPQGYYYLEPCATLQQLFPHMVPDTVKDQAAQMNQLAHLEQEVYRLSFRYQREKSDINFDGQRAQSGRAKEMRGEVSTIVNNLDLDRNTKYQLILDKMEVHYKELIQANSSSELKEMLQKLLINHGRTYQIHEASLPRAALAGLVDVSLSLLKESVSFAGNLGHVGGATLFFVGTGIEDFGKRTNELLGKLGYNPLKYLVSAIAYTLEIVGYAIKNSFGLKPLTEAICSGIKYIRDALVRAIRQDEVVRVQENIVPEAHAKHPVNVAADYRTRLQEQHEAYLHPEHAVEKSKDCPPELPISHI